jgi:hypothetical protein
VYCSFIVSRKVCRFWSTQSLNVTKKKKLKQCPLSGWFIKIIAHYSEDETKKKG